MSGVDTGVDAGIDELGALEFGLSQTSRYCTGLAVQPASATGAQAPDTMTPPDHHPAAHPCKPPQFGKVCISGLVSGLLLIAACWQTTAEARPAMRCSGGLVQERDSIATVARRCAEPFWTERWESPRAVGRSRGEPVFSMDTIESWYFNFGANRLMRRLVFRNGELWRIQQLGHGLSYEPGSRSCSPRQLETAGDTAGEIWARCGPPAYSHHRSESVRRGFLVGPGVPEVHIEVWTYDLGDQHLIREVTFRDGRLHRIQTLRR